MYSIFRKRYYDSNVTISERAKLIEIKQWVSANPWGDDDWLESFEDGPNSDGGVHAAEVKNRIVNTGRFIIGRFDQQSEALRVGADESGEIG